jgi:hypothetical protein
MSRDQPPRGGCLNCGADVRTRKDGMWLCWRCDRKERAVRVRMVRANLAGISDAS